MIPATGVVPVPNAPGPADGAPAETGNTVTVLVVGFGAKMNFPAGSVANVLTPLATLNGEPATGARTPEFTVKAYTAEKFGTGTYKKVPDAAKVSPDGLEPTANGDPLT